MDWTARTSGVPTRITGHSGTISNPIVQNSVPVSYPTSGRSQTRQTRHVRDGDGHGVEHNKSHYEREEACAEGPRSGQDGTKV